MPAARMQSRARYVLLLGCYLTNKLQRPDSYTSIPWDRQSSSRSKLASKRRLVVRETPFHLALALFPSAIVGEFPDSGERERRFVRLSDGRKRRCVSEREEHPREVTRGVITEWCRLNCFGPSEQPEADPVSRHVPVHPAPEWMHRVSSKPLYSAGANLSGVGDFPSIYRYKSHFFSLLNLMA